MASLRARAGTRLEHAGRTLILRRGGVIRSMAAARNGGSLRETGLIPIPQLSPPRAKLYESTHNGFAPDPPLRAARADPRRLSSGALAGPGSKALF